MVGGQITGPHFSAEWEVLCRMVPGTIQLADKGEVLHKGQTKLISIYQKMKRVLREDSAFLVPQKLNVAPSRVNCQCPRFLIESGTLHPMMMTGNAKRGEEGKYIVEAVA